MSEIPGLYIEQPAQSHRLVIEEPPLTFIPALAAAIGLHEAIIVQQLQYWLKKSKHVHDGAKWVYNSYAEWHEQFPFMSQKTIERTFRKLEEQGIVKSGNFNEKAFDRTKWYSLNYDKIPQFDDVQPSTQNVPTNRTVCPDQQDSQSSPIPGDYTETTEDLNSNSSFHSELESETRQVGISHVPNSEILDSEGVSESPPQSEATSAPISGSTPTADLQATAPPPNTCQDWQDRIREADSQHDQVAILVDMVRHHYPHPPKVPGGHAAALLKQVRDPPYAVKLLWEAMGTNPAGNVFSYAAGIFGRRNGANRQSVNPRRAHEAGASKGRPWTIIGGSTPGAEANATRPWDPVGEPGPGDDQAAV